MCFRISYVGEFNSGFHVFTTICVAFRAKLPTYFFLFLGRFVWNRHTHLLDIVRHFHTYSNVQHIQSLVVTLSAVEPLFTLNAIKLFDFVSFFRVIFFSFSKSYLQNMCHQFHNKQLLFEQHQILLFLYFTPIEIGISLKIWFLLHPISRSCIYSWTNDFRWIYWSSVRTKDTVHAYIFHLIEWNQVN